MVRKCGADPLETIYDTRRLHSALVTGVPSTSRRLVREKVGSRSGVVLAESSITTVFLTKVLATMSHKSVIRDARGLRSLGAPNARKVGLLISGRT